MSENGVSVSAMSAEETRDVNGYHNGDNGYSSSSKEKRKETEEERRIRKEKERREKEERYRKEGRRPETEEERRIRKEKERKEKDGKRKETEEERKIRKEKERREREERHKKEGKREETEEERRIRKEKERKEREERHKKEETEEERRKRKEKERKEREEGKTSKHRKETEEERRIRKERERQERKMKQEMKNEDESSQEVPVKEEPMEEDYPETPIDEKPAKRKPNYIEDDEEEEVAPTKKKRKIKQEDDDYDDEEEDYKPKKSSKKSASKKKAASPPPQPAAKKAVKKEPAATPTKTGGRKAKKEEPQTVWKWWEEEKRDDGTKWKFLQHKGPLFAPLYERLPDNINFYYDGRKMRLSEEAEEVATFYGKMLDHDYTSKEVFNKNFFKDWRKVMTEKEKETIRDLSKCDFSEINVYFKKVSEERKARGKEERKAEKERNDEIQKEYGVAIIDGHEEKIGNFRIEPPGLFRGRGEHPKQGMMKRRVQPEDVIINCSKDSEWPQPPAGHKWKEVRHDNTVTWLASWTENIQNQIKYVMLNPSSRLKGEKDMEKYEKARRLKSKIVKIRDDYTADFKSKEMRIRQRAVALYFIDKLALRAGNEKDEDQADTVGCCSLRVEHISLHEEHDGKEFVVEFDFLGKDSIRYHNFVQVEKRVFKNLQLFMENKKEGDDLFDRLNTSILNEYLSSLMPGLTAKVFRTYNASITLQEQLKKLTDASDNIAAKMLSYNRANRAVAILCNHQRAVPKTHETSMANLQAKIDKKAEEVEKAEKEYKSAKKKGSSAEADKKKNTLKRLLEQLNRLETQKTDKEENKQIALGTSKLNYLDPRISVAWCRKFDVPIEKVYNKTQREKFRWAIEMVDDDYEF